MRGPRLAGAGGLCALDASSVPFDDPSYPVTRDDLELVVIPERNVQHRVRLSEGARFFRANLAEPKEALGQRLCGCDEDCAHSALLHRLA